MQYQWAEDDFSLPYGVNRLGLSEPVSGNKYIMYHGTTRQNAQSILATGFQQSEDGMLGRGVYLSRDVEKARRYPIGHPECDKVVIRVLVNVGQVIAINFKGHPLQKTWQAYGYDTAWVPPGCGMVKSGLEEDCVWDPCQIQIIDTINPRPVQPYYGCGPYGYMGRGKQGKTLQSEGGAANHDSKPPHGSLLATRLIQMVSSHGVLLKSTNPLSYSDTDTNMNQGYRSQTYIMYHGTTRKAAKTIKSEGFRQSADGMLGRGVYLSRDVEKASRYPIGHPESDKVIIMVDVKVGKVKMINYQGHPLQKTWHDAGYDTAWVPPGCGMVASGSEEDCVWDPDRVNDSDTSMNKEFKGKKYIMYHGTTRENAEAIESDGFRQSKDGMLGRGVYLSRDVEKASRYPIGHPDSDKVVIMVEVSVGRVKKIDYKGHPLQKTWHDHGYNTAWVPPGCKMVKSGLEEDCVWNPKRIEYIKTIQVDPTGCLSCSGAWSQTILEMKMLEVEVLGWSGLVTGGLQIKVNSQPSLLEEEREEESSDTNMQYQWAEDDCILPPGVCRLDGGAPDCGKTYIMYHGTTRQNAQSILATGFRQSADGMLGRGVYLSRDLQKASRYPINHPECDKVVIRVMVNVGQVISITYQGHPRQKTWHDCRCGPVYDTAWMIPRCGMVPSVLQDCVWDPCRIQIIDIINPCPIQVFPGCVPCVYTGC
ncbi:uncharacterized protein LOC123967395 [Micropterus dolomieu]|uniref:uncharacterized protein LOC123967395 n=1 Tax=Micropterus dolomieu TaxID=147949 RepID=UPI001E8ED2C1|nr:uncharacterized protein LOC123967395 [Micropterus dolomieu]